MWWFLVRYLSRCGALDWLAEKPGIRQWAARRLWNVELGHRTRPLLSLPISKPSFQNVPDFYNAPPSSLSRFSSALINIAGSRLEGCIHFSPYLLPPGAPLSVLQSREADHPQSRTRHCGLVNIKQLCPDNYFGTYGSWRSLSKLLSVCFC